MSVLPEIVGLFGKEAIEETIAKEGVGEVLGKEAVEGAVEKEGVGELGASKVLDDTVAIQNREINIELAGRPVAEGGAEARAGLEDGIGDAQREMIDVVQRLERNEAGAIQEARALERNWKETFKNIWSGAKTFGKFVAIETLKGALFYAGMKAIEVAWVKLFPPKQVETAKSGGTKVLVDDDRVKIIKAINKAGSIIQPAIVSWSNWQAAHYQHKKSYGEVVASGLPIQLFQVLQNAISSVGEVRDAMVPLQTKATNEKSLESAKALLTADIAYAKRVVDLADQIRTSMKSMIGDGLPDKHTELQAAYTILINASS